MKEQLLIFGIGAAAKTIYNFVNYYDLYDIVGFTIDEEYMSIGDTLYGLNIYPVQKLDQYFKKSDIKLFVAIQWNAVNRDRKDVYLRLKEAGYSFANIISPSAIIHNECKIGENCWIADNSVLETGVTIGNNVFIKGNCYVAHFSIVEDHVFLGVGSIVAGAAVVGEQSFVGLKAIIFDTIRVGKKCIVGTNTMIKKHLPSFCLVSMVTEPVCQQIIKKYSEEEIEAKLCAYSKKSGYEV